MSFIKRQTSVETVKTFRHYCIWYHQYQEYGTYKGIAKNITLIHNHWLERVGYIIIFYRGSWSRFWNPLCINFARAINTYWFLDFMIHWNIFVIVDASFIGHRGLISSSREIRSSLCNLHWSRKCISSSISLALQNWQTLSSLNAIWSNQIEPK